MTYSLRHTWKWYYFVLIMTCCCSSLYAKAADMKQNGGEVAGILLTWIEDPATTMVLDFHTLSGYTGPSEISFRRLGKSKWKQQQGVNFAFPFTDRTVYRVHLNRLKPGTTYEFRFGQGEEIYRFRTMPKNIRNSSVCFVTGGDTMHDKADMDRTNRVALAYDPDFIVWGGDFAYANGDPKNAGRWIQWFDSVKETLVDKNNRVVPIIGSIGNHEVQKSTFKNHEGFNFTDEARKQIAPYFYSFFAFPGLQGYNTLDFRKYLSLIVLDTEHSNPIAGRQTAWLNEALAARSKVPHVFPVYHVPAYPSVRPFNTSVSVLVRDNFVPLFEKHGVKLAFESHDHAYKRTHPLFQGQVNENGKGVVYLGDGAWGVKKRPVTNAWYLEKAESVNHCIVVTLRGMEVDLKMVNDQGQQFDQYQIK